MKRVQLIKVQPELCRDEQFYVLIHHKGAVVGARLGSRPLRRIEASRREAGFWYEKCLSSRAPSAERGDLRDYPTEIAASPTAPRNDKRCGILIAWKCIRT